MTTATPSSFIADTQPAVQAPSSFMPDQGGSSMSGSTSATTGNSVLDGFKTMGEGAVNFVNNNPISRGLVSLAALPTQLAVKGVNAVTGKNYPDPFAGGIGAKDGPFEPVGVTSSDQPAGKFAASEVGNALTVGSLFAPVGEAATAAGEIARAAVPKFLSGPAAFLTRLGTHALFGMGVGTAGALQNGVTDPAQLKSAATTGALISGGLHTAGELGAALLDNFASNTGESRLMEQKNNLKTLTRSFNDTSTPVSNPIQTMEQNGITRDLRVIDGKVNVERITNVNNTGSIDNMIEQEQQMGTQAVAGMKGTVPVDDFKDSTINTIKSSPALKASGKVGKTVAEVSRMFDDYKESYGDNVKYEDINNIRVAMNKMWNPDTWDAEKAVGSSARSILYTGKGAGAALQSAMKNEQELINAKEFINKLSGTAVKGGRLGKYMADMVGSGIGGAMGSSFGPFGVAAGAAAGGAATDKVMGMYQANYFNPLLSGPAQKIQSVVGSPAATAIGRGARTLMIDRAVK